MFGVAYDAIFVAIHRSEMFESEFSEFDFGHRGPAAKHMNRHLMASGMIGMPISFAMLVRHRRPHLLVPFLGLRPEKTPVPIEIELNEHFIRMGERLLSRDVRTVQAILA